MSTIGQPNTLRRILASTAVVAAALILFDGGRGLTGRAGGGELGCGGVASVEHAGGDGQSLTASGGGATRRGVARKSQLVAVLAPGQTQVHFRARLSSNLPSYQGRPSFGKSQLPSSGNALPGLGQPSGRSLFEVLERMGATQFSTDLRASRFAPLLDDPRNAFTVFAPSDAAWEQLRAERPDLFEPQNRVFLEEVMGQHIVARELDPDDLDSELLEALVPGATIDLAVSRPTAEVRSGAGTEAEISLREPRFARNGVLFRADGILMPHFTLWTHLRALGFDNFVTAVEATGQVPQFANPEASLTVLVPTDEAFRVGGWDAAKLREPALRAEVQAILDAHVLEPAMSQRKLGVEPREASDGAVMKVIEEPGQPAMVERPASGQIAAFKELEQATENGYLHVIDTLLAD